MVVYNFKSIQRYSLIGYKVLKALNNLLIIFILAKQQLPLQYSYRVELCPVFSVLFYAVNVIIKMAVCKLIDIGFDPYTSAVGEKHTTAACGGRLAFLMRKDATPTKAEKRITFYK